MKNFLLEHPNESVINANPILRSCHLLLITAKNEAWEAYFKALQAPKTIEDLIWIIAKAGHTQLIAPLMNLSKVTRIFPFLQPIMRMSSWEGMDEHGFIPVVQIMVLLLVSFAFSLFEILM